MAFRTVRVFLHNETESALALTHAALDHGAWGDDGQQSPPAAIPAWATVMMRSETSGFLTGTEAHVSYRIGDDEAQAVNVHWSNPAAGSISYHQSTDDDHFVFRVGSGGNDAVVHFYLRAAGLRATGFLPSQDGFRFQNKWPGDTPYSLPPLRGSNLDLKYGNAASGLCGGMVFAACDYFSAGLTIPQTEAAPPGEQDPLFVYLVDRLFATFGELNVSLMLKLMAPWFPDTDENVLGVLGLASGRASVMAHEEWPLVRSDIDAGRPSPMALITVKSALPWDLGKCHQVLAYAYDVHGDDVAVHVYDPNQPNRDDIRLRFNTKTVAERIVIDHNVAIEDDDKTKRRPIYCFIRLAYDKVVPPVSTPPRRPGLSGALPRQFALEITDKETLSSTFLDQGRKEYEVLMCGPQMFDFHRYAQQQRVTVEAHPVGYADPVVTWHLNDVPVPPGIDQVVTPFPSGLGDSDALLAYLPGGAHGVTRVSLSTATEGMRLTATNVAGDGVYGLTARAVVTERDGGQSRQSGIDCSFIGIKELVPGLAEAGDRCLHEYVRSLRVEGPTEEEFIAAVYARIGRPDDPLWDPDPLQLLTDVQDGLIDPDREKIVDPAALFNPDQITVVDLAGPERVLTATEGTEVLTVDFGWKARGTATDLTEFVVVNSTARDLVLVDTETHESLAVVPANEELTWSAEAGTFRASGAVES